jgi:hypothetical protein
MLLLVMLEGTCVVTFLPTKRASFKRPPFALFFFLAFFLFFSLFQAHKHALLWRKVLKLSSKKKSKILAVAPTIVTK